MKFFKIILLTVLLVAGCYSGFGEEVQHWFFKEGQHRGHLANKGFLERYNISKSDDQLSFEAIFAENCRYILPDGYEQINKLSGIIVGMNPHYNSARIGWMWNDTDNVMEIYAYWYINGARDWKILGVVNTNEWFMCQVNVSGTGYLFSLNGLQFEVLGEVEMATTFRAYPYFGGKYPAPHLMMLTIREV